MIGELKGEGVKYVSDLVPSIIISLYFYDIQLNSSRTNISINASLKPSRMACRTLWDADSDSLVKNVFMNVIRSFSSLSTKVCEL